MPNAQSPRGKQSADPIGVVPLRLADDRRAAYEGYLSKAITRFGMPGAAVAVIQGGEVAYLRGFGIKELGGTEPVTPDTSAHDRLHHQADDHHACSRACGRWPP